MLPSGDEYIPSQPSAFPNSSCSFTTAVVGAHGRDVITDEMFAKILCPAVPGLTTVMLRMAERVARS
jgi:hypothetical protein